MGSGGGTGSAAPTKSVISVVHDLGARSELAFHRDLTAIVPLGRAVSRAGVGSSTGASHVACIYELDLLDITSRYRATPVLEWNVCGMVGGLPGPRFNFAPSVVHGTPLRLYKGFELYHCHAQLLLE